MQGTVKIRREPCLLLALTKSPQVASARGSRFVASKEKEKDFVVTKVSVFLY